MTHHSRHPKILSHTSFNMVIKHVWRIRKFLSTWSILGIVIILSMILGTSNVRGYLEDGFRATSTPELKRVVEFWSRSIFKNPRAYEAYINRGSAYFCNGYVYRGIADWHVARELSPAFAYAVFTGDFIWQTKSRGRLLNYAVSIELDQRRIVSVIMTGITYMELGQYAKAGELYRKSIDLTKNPLLKSQLEYWANAINGISHDK